MTEPTATSADEAPGRWRSFRHSRRFWPVVIAAIVVVAITGGGGFYAARELSKVPVPRLADTNLVAAEAKLRRLGLVPSTTVIPAWLRPFATVKSQAQPRGTRLLPGSKVVLALSFRKVAVPQPATGMTYRAAVTAFHRAGLDVIADAVSLPISQNGPLPPNADQKAVIAYIAKLGIDGTPNFSGAPFAAKVDRTSMGGWAVALKDGSPRTMTAGSVIHLVATIPVSVAPTLLGRTLTTAGTTTTTDQLKLKTDGHDPSWVVTTQTPAPGTVIGWGSSVTVTSLDCGPMQALENSAASLGVDPTPRTANEFTSKLGLPALPDAGCDYITSSTGTFLSGTSIRLYFPTQPADLGSRLSAWASGLGLVEDTAPYLPYPPTVHSWSGKVTGCSYLTILYGTDQYYLDPTTLSQYSFAPDGAQVAIGCTT